jgi:N-acetylneuraminic acid mutarotase
MASFRKSEVLTDITLRAGGRPFQAHRVVLAAASPYFAAMFTGGMNETRLDEVEVEGVDSVAMEVMLDCVYSSVVTLTESLNESNVQRVLPAARMLQMDSVVEHCCNFLAERLNAENCLGIFQFADLHSCANLAKTAWNYALSHFDDISSREEFFSLSYNTLSALLAEDNLNSSSEESVLKSVIQWVKHDLESRSSFIADLLKPIRLLCLPWTVLVENVLNYDMIAQREDCQSIIEEIKTYHFTKESRSPQLQPRNSFSNNNCIYLVGGEARPSRNVLNTVTAFIPETHVWKTLSPMATCRRGAAITILNDKLFAIGGSDGKQALHSLEMYDIENDSWSSYPSMNEARSSVACEVLNDEIYAVGGYDGHTQCLSSVEKFSVKRGTWTYVSSMMTSRSMLGVAVIDGVLFAIGGYDGSSDIPLCERYDVIEDSWSPIPSMQSCRCLAAVTAHNQKIFVAGGTNQDQPLDSVEVYDTVTDSWSTAVSLNEPRVGATLATVGEDLYVLGGNDDEGTIDKFDFIMNKWVLVTRMESIRGRFSCCSSI